MTFHRDRGSSGCGRLMGCGCTFVVLMLILLAAVVFLNREKLGEVVASGKEAMQSMMRLRNELSAEFPSGGLNIGLRTASGGGKAMTLEFTDPGFETGSDEEWQSKAWEIARFASERYEGIDGLDAIFVEVTSKTGGGLVSMTQRTARFDVETLQRGLRIPPVETESFSEVEGSEGKEGAIGSY